MLDPVGPAPETRQPRFLWLLLGCAIAPLFWLGQMMLGYGVTAHACYPADHPVGMVSTESLFTVLIIFDLIALTLCAAGAFTAMSESSLLIRSPVVAATAVPAAISGAGTARAAATGEV